MKLPGAERAIVDVEKLRSYSLSPTHLRGRHKARVFASALKLLQSEAEWLRARLLEAALHGDAMEVEADEYGKRYILDFECVKEGRAVYIRSGWIVRRDEDFPRLTTCYVLSK
jgi:hypothetical protein